VFKALSAELRQIDSFADEFLIGLQHLFRFLTVLSTFLLLDLLIAGVEMAENVRYWVYGVKPMMFVAVRKVVETFAFAIGSFYDICKMPFKVYPDFLFYLQGSVCLALQL
jgi:hypothetical protein